MGTGRHKLSALKIKQAGKGSYQDGGCLVLVKPSKDAGKWIYRYSAQKNRRDMGLGSWPSVSLADARKHRDKWEAVKNEGKDPIAQRQKELAELFAHNHQNEPTFLEAFESYFETYKETLKKKGVAGNWRSPIEVHAIPKIGKRRVSDLKTEDIKSVLEPIWKPNHPTAEKVAQRIRLILTNCEAYNEKINPEIVKKAERQLGPVVHIKNPITSTPWDKVPALYKKLNRSTSADLALRLLILTAVRKDSVCGARFDEIEGTVWKVPPERVKGRAKRTEDFRVPLSTEALRVVEECRKRSKNQFLFPGHKNRAIHGNTLLKRLNELKEPGRPHGFRSSFKDWCRETNPESWEVHETALDHAVGNEVERSYQRSDLLNPRTRLMAKWAAFVVGKTQVS